MSHASHLDQPHASSRKLFNELTLRADIALIAVLAVVEIEVFYYGMDWRLGGLIIASVLSMSILLIKNATNAIFVVMIKAQAALLSF